MLRKLTYAVTDSQHVFLCLLSAECGRERIKQSMSGPYSLETLNPARKPYIHQIVTNVIGTILQKKPTGLFRNM